MGRGTQGTSGSGFLEALFSGVKAFVREAVTVVREAVHVILEEIDQSSFGRAATQLVKGISDTYFSRPKELAEEESEIVAKRQRDGVLRGNDQQRLLDIQKERNELRQQLERERIKRAASALDSNQESLVAQAAGIDDVSSAIGIIATKECPQCHGTMRIRQGRYDPQKDRASFYWQCTTLSTCPSITFDPTAMNEFVVRDPHPDLDGPRQSRLEVWKRDDVSQRAHTRIRGVLGEPDTEVTCPTHLLPMKLLPKRVRGGRMLDSYEWVCPGVMQDGRECTYVVPLETYGQASAVLRRTDGKGIIDG